MHQESLGLLDLNSRPTSPPHIDKRIPKQSSDLPKLLNPRSDPHSELNPNDVMDVIPVIPPDLRPLVRSERHLATSSNDLIADHQPQ